MMEQGIHKGPLLVACPDVNDHTGRFVDDKQVVILEKDVQGNILGMCSGRWLVSLLLNAVDIASLHFIAAANRGSVQGYPPRFHKGLDLGTGKLR